MQVFQTKPYFLRHMNQGLWMMKSVDVAIIQIRNAHFHTTANIMTIHIPGIKGSDQKTLQDSLYLFMWILWNSFANANHCDTVEATNIKAKQLSWNTFSHLYRGTSAYTVNSGAIE